MINYNDDLETGGVIFLPKDSGFPQIYRFKMSDSGINELAHIVLVTEQHEQQDQTVRVSFQTYF